MKDYLSFTKQGVTYIAYEGHAHAESLGKTVWSKEGVFIKNPLTKKAVLELDEFMRQKEYQDNWFKRQYSFD